MKLLPRIPIRIAFLAVLSLAISCESMLDDMGNGITSLRKQMTAMLRVKPLPRISLFYEINEIPAGQLIDMGQWLVGSTTPKTIQITVTNIGSIPVNLEEINMKEKYAGLFTLGNLQFQDGTPITLPAAVPVDGTFTFTVSFQLPDGEAGYRAAILSINMGEEYSLFNVTVACEGTEEERGLLVVGGMIDKLMTELDGSVPYDIGYPYNTPLRLWNRGTRDLIVNDISLSYKTDFELSPVAAPITLAPDSYKDIQVYFQGTSYDIQLSDILTIEYEDGVTSDMQFTLELTGTMKDEQDAQIEVYKGSVSCLDNATYSFHPQLTSSASYGMETFQIHNAGYGDLELDIVLSGDEDYPDNNFTYSGPYKATVLPGDDTSFTVRYNPKDDADHSMTVTITSNDPDDGDSSYVINISGSSLLSIMHVACEYQGETNEMDNSSTRTFGRWGADGDGKHRSDPATCTMTNSGSIPLDITGITLNGSGPGHFDLDTSSTNMSVPAYGGSTTFEIRFDPLTWNSSVTEDMKVAYVTIANNDVDLPLYYINVNGVAKEPLMNIYAKLNVLRCTYSNDVSGGVDLIWQYTVSDIPYLNSFVLASHSSEHEMNAGDSYSFGTGAYHQFTMIPKSQGNGIKFNFPTADIDDWPNDDDHSSKHDMAIQYNADSNQLEYLYYTLSIDLELIPVLEEFPFDGVSHPGIKYFYITDNAELNIEFELLVKDYLYPQD